MNPWSSDPLIDVLIHSLFEQIHPVRLTSEKVSLFEPSVPGFLVVGEDRIPLTQRVWIVGAGKASIQMAQGIEKVLGSRIAGGRVLALSDGADLALPARVDVFLASHPHVTDQNVRGTEELIRFLGQIPKDDLVIGLWSGGGSAMLESPVPGVSIDEINQAFDRLTDLGQPIQVINLKRKALSRVKGGGLLSFVNSERILALVLSDIVGGHPDAVASGPFWGSKNGKQVPHFLMGTSETAAHALARSAAERGLEVQNFKTRLTGEASKAGEQLAEETLEHIKKFRRNPLCLISAGETTVKLRNVPRGLGGRNLEVLLAFECALRTAIDWSEIRMRAFSLATDGKDGPSFSAGAMTASEVLGHRSHSEALDALAHHDSYRYFERWGGILKARATGTNLADLFCVTLERQRR